MPLEQPGRRGGRLGAAGKARPTRRDAETRENLLDAAIDSLESATQWLLARKSSDAALAGATPYLRLFGYAAGGCMLAADAIAASRRADGTRRTELARFFAENIAVQAGSLERTVTGGAESILAVQAALAE